MVDLDRENLFYASRLHLNDFSVSHVFRALDAVLGLRSTFAEIWERASKEMTDVKNDLNHITASFGIALIPLETDDLDNSDIRDKLIFMFNEYAVQTKINTNDGPSRYISLTEDLVKKYAFLLRKAKWNEGSKWANLHDLVVKAQVSDTRRIISVSGQ